MQEIRAPFGHPELKEVVAEASRALARLDACRLEELVLSCRALNRALPAASAAEKGILRRQAAEAQSEMAVFGHVLEATRSNLKVMNRLRELRMGRLEYSVRQVSGSAGTESGHGEH
jgi:hypothetical protein